VNGYSIHPQISQISAIEKCGPVRFRNLRNLRTTFPVRHRGGEAIRVHSWLLPKKYFPDENADLFTPVRTTP